VILGIETSCDETALALFDPATGLRGEWVHSQIALHGAYGGVVPDLASREHLRNFPVLLARMCAMTDGSAVTQIAVTNGPGLAGCLAIGLAAAKSLAQAWRVPLVGVNHLRGHAFSPFIALHRKEPARFDERLDALLPHLGLLVSGGNTVLFRIGRSRRLRTLASTTDDAAGEALDKGAKLLGLGYPGGPLIEKMAAAGRPDAFAFPRAQVGGFSFSGVKTSLRYMVERLGPDETERRRPDLCASYQEAIVDALVARTRKELRAGGYASVGLSGGVANNQRLRSALAEVARRANVRCLEAAPEHTGDNAAMIAFAAWADPAGVMPDEDHALAFEPGLALPEK
jgi:N6-L-threonylcarbamoyladenine synthase